ncbi:uncharacterized protein LOC131238749 [Magnolia sinica]|uniref:uncharacterized protein LOC131238749 n=1 Tax=Magnolia sinica TaxID=86752 RepID=UPI0026599C06|nr:uncharacterized protein LOC131238749 [Magnolia sinica]
MECERDPCGSISICKDQLPGAEDLMDEHWFFHSMFNTTRTFTSSMDNAMSCSDTTMEMIVSNPSNEGPPYKANHPQGHALLANNFLGNPSPPHRQDVPKTAREEVNQGPPNVLYAQQSVDDMVSLCRNYPSEITIQKPTIPRDGSRRNLSDDGSNKDSKNCRIVHHRRIWKSMSDLEFEEVQGFMDLGFIFNKEDISPSVLNMIPGLQEKRPIDGDKVRRPYLSEAWVVQTSDPPILNWVYRKSAVDMKEQLKVWARTVASNVRREC